MSGTKKMSNAARAAGAENGPGAKEHKRMFRKLGFTLVELLVVIAIISILAAIVTPKVQGFILRSRMTNTVAEIQGIETALAKMLTDCGKSSFRQMFDNAPDVPVDTSANPATVDYAKVKPQIGQFTDAFYSLLRQGRNAPISEAEGGTADGRTLRGGLHLAEGVKDKLATSYVDANFDAWDRKYQFWAGPWGSKGAIPFRCYRVGVTRESDDEYLPYIYSGNNITIKDDGTEGTVDRKKEMDEKLPGNPQLDNLNGYPAPSDLGMYVFSLGVNGQNDQVFGTPRGDDNTLWGGGDDINNWDGGEQGWTGFYS